MARRWARGKSRRLFVDHACPHLVLLDFQCLFGSRLQSGLRRRECRHRPGGRETNSRQVDPAAGPVVANRSSCTAKSGAVLDDDVPGWLSADAGLSNRRGRRVNDLEWDACRVVCRIRDRCMPSGGHVLRLFQPVGQPLRQPFSTDAADPARVTIRGTTIPRPWLGRVTDMTVGEESPALSEPVAESEIVSLMQIVGRIVRARVGRRPGGGPRPGDPDQGARGGGPGRARDARAVCHRHRAQPRGLDVEGTRTGDGAISTASSSLHPDAAPDRRVLRREEQEAGLRRAWPAFRARPADPARPRGRGTDTRSLADELGLTAGAVAAQLNRTRARMRVEYLLAVAGIEPADRPLPTGPARAVQRRPATAAGGRRRAAPARVRGLCGAQPATAATRQSRGQRHHDPDPWRPGHRRGAQAGPPAGVPAELLSDRRDLDRDRRFGDRPQYCRFAGDGLIVMGLIEEPRPRCADRGTGHRSRIADVEQALADGYSTYNGLGLGLPGARRLMDEFSLTSELGEGTTVTMTKWRSEG